MPLADHSNSFFARCSLSRPPALFSLIFAALTALIAATSARAITNDELLPANLVGKTLTCTYSAGTPNTLETTNNFTIQFTSATTYVRTSPTLATEGGTYSVLDSSIAASTGNRATTIQINNNWLSQGSTTAILLVLTQQNGFGAYAASEFFNPLKNTGGLFTIGGSTTGGGGSSNAIPSITSAFSARGSIGTPFTYQITATNSPTRYAATGLPAGLSIDTATGLISGTPTGNASNTDVTISAINAAGATTAPITFSITAGSAATAAPVITSATTATATVGTPFTYQITATPAATSYTNAGGNAPVQINPTTGLVVGTFTAAGTYTFSYTALNAIGGTKPTVVTVTVTGGATGGGTAAYAGTYTGSIFIANNGAAETIFTTFSGTVSAAGALVAQGGEVTGTVTSSGAVIFASNGLGLSTGTIVNGQLNALGAPNVLGTTTRIFRIAAATSSATVLATAPTNLVGYRNKVGGVYQFSVTGVARGAVWGTDVYTDDSSVATAAVHAGVLAAGETKTVTVTILAGRPSYPASTRNGVASASWGSWAGSYSFAGAGAVTASTTAGNVATAVPTLAPGFVATTTALAAGGRLVCPIAVSGGGTYSYQWYLNNVLIPGATVNPYVVDTLTAANAGTYTVNVTNSLNPGATNRLTAGTVTVGATGSPVLALQPISKTVVPGATFTLAANASGSGLAYQWFRNNVALAGETGAILLRNNANAADSGTYTVRISNSSGSVTSSAATVTLSANASRPANISVRTNVATGTLVTPGFVVQGSGTKRVLIRAVGPGLAAFGLAGTMADPKFTVFQGSTKIAESDDWTPANIGSAFTATGAFNLPANSKDAALVTDLTAGKDYTVQVTNASGTGGIVLVEVYDADALRGTSTSKLVNVSVRGQTAPGDDVLTLGLVIGGVGPRTLLVRGIGPKLASFGVEGTVPDPRLQIVDSQGRIILANDDWAAADFVSELALASQYVGAFALDAGSKDAATLSLVDPGSYTIQVSGTSTSPTGEALVEVYEVP